MFFSIFSLQGQEETFQKNPIFSNLDGLYCEEGDLGGLDDEEKTETCVEEENNVGKGLTLMENDLLWEDVELVRLLSKEKEAHFGGSSSSGSGSGSGSVSTDGLLMVARNVAVEWMLRVVAHYGFKALTGVLAVNYFDRFMSSFCFQKDKPWMSQLVAVACLSVAAKMEEIQVPLLLDLQVGNSKFVFEAKTIMRMELLVLSALKWRTSIVTPVSFFDHIVRRFGLMYTLHREFLKRCERVLISIIADSRLVHCLPSVIAAATMLFVIKEIDPYDGMDYKNQLIDLLKIGKEKVDECYKIVLERVGGADHCLQGHDTSKRKHLSVPSSPSGVFDAYFSCDSSNESWSVASSVSSTPEPAFKRSRAREQHMRLAPLSSVSVSIGSSRHR